MTYIPRAGVEDGTDRLGSVSLHADDGSDSLTWALPTPADSSTILFADFDVCFSACSN